MAQLVKFDNKLPSFGRSAKNVLQDALNEAARDVLINAKDKAPFQKGALRAASDISTPNFLTKRISFWVEYARFQEFGGDGKRQVRNYSTSGTGAHFLRNAGDNAKKNIARTFAKHAKRARP